MRIAWRPLLAFVATVIALSWTACGGEDGRPSATAPELEDGVLQVGSNIAYAPLEFFEEGSERPKGLDIDLGEALADQLGVEVDFQNQGFDSLIPALQDGEIDAIMSAMTVTDERSREIDFIAYLNVGTGVLVAAGNPEGVRTLEDLCGLTVAVQADTIQVDQVNTLNEGACADTQIDLLTFSQNPLAVEQLRLGGADSVLADDPVVVNDARLSDGQLEVAVSGFQAAPYGIGVRKDASALRADLQDALETLIDNGTYGDILQEWNLSFGSIE